MDYLLVKQLHMGLALISISGFVLRWYWRMHQSPLAFTQATRIIPHAVDTLLLASAVTIYSRSAAKDNSLRQSI